MYGKSNKQTYITICKIDIQQELAVWLMKLTQGICINLEGWEGEGDGREFLPWISWDWTPALHHLLELALTHIH